MKQYKFFFHYNKPASVAAGRPRVSIHYRQKCHIVDNLVVEVPINGKPRKTQPRFVMEGKAGSFVIKNNIGYLT